MGKILTLDELLAHWEGHRRLTRRTIAAFPEDQLFSYKVEAHLLEVDPPPDWRSLNRPAGFR